MSYKKNKAEFNELLNNNPERKRYWSKEAFKTIDDAVCAMVDTLDVLKEGETVAVGDDEVKTIERATNMVLGVVKNRMVTDWMRRFSLMFSKFVVNYDINVGGVGLKGKAETIQRLVEANYALRDLIQLAKELKVDDRQTQSAKLARHYLKSLEE